MRKMEFTYEAVCQLIGFFHSMGFATYEKKLKERRDVFLKARDNLISKGYSGYDFNALQKEIAERLDKFEKAISELRETYNAYLKKITIVEPSPEEVAEGAEALPYISDPDNGGGQ